MAIPAKLHRNPAQRAAKPLRLEVDWGLAYEALVGLIMFTGEENESSYEVGLEWFRSTRGGEADRRACRALAAGRVRRPGSIPTAGPQGILANHLAPEGSTPC